MIEVIDPKYLYYVYTLAYPDGTVFYVGKGMGGRLLSHEGEAQRGHDCRKCEVIRGIWNEGKKVRRAIIFRTNDEQAALQREKETIAKYRCDQLCNHDPRQQRTPREVLEYRQEMVNFYKEEKEIQRKVAYAKYQKYKSAAIRRLVAKGSEQSWKDKISDPD